MEQVRIVFVASVVHVVFGKPLKPAQLGPLQVNWSEKYCPGPQVVSVPFKVVISTKPSSRTSIKADRNEGQKWSKTKDLESWTYYT